jgi:fatty acid desaturase
MRIFEGFDKHVFKSNSFWSLRLIPGTWLRFFLLSVVWPIVPALLTWQLFYSSNSTIKSICSLGLAFFLPFCSMCYFRLFGRLAWAVEVAVGKKLEELEALAAAEDDDWNDEPEERSYDSRIDLPDYALRD